jgi:hypothetical protein
MREHLSSFALVVAKFTGPNGSEGGMVRERRDGSRIQSTPFDNQHIGALSADFLNCLYLTLSSDTASPALGTRKWAPCVMVFARRRVST